MPILNTFSGGGGGIRIPLEAPTGFNSSISDGTISFSWTDPVDKVANPGGELVSEWNYTLVVRKAGSAPLTPTDGYQVLRTTSRNQYSATPFVDTGLDNDVTYYYAIYAYSTLGVPSEALIGNATPTYFASISYEKQMSLGLPGSSMDSGLAAGGNGGYAFFIFTDIGEFKGSYFDTELTRKSFTPIVQHPESSARVGNIAIFTGGTQTADPWTPIDISIDGNAVQQEIKTRGSGSAWMAADVDHKCAYVFPGRNSTSGYRYDSNMVSSGLGGPPNGDWERKTLSSKYYAVFSGRSVVSAYYGDIYLYNENGTRSTANTPLCLGDDVTTSRCDEYILIAGGSESASGRVDNGNVYAISKDLVVTYLGVTSDNSGGETVSNNESYDMQTNGLGAILHAKPSGSTDNFVRIYNKQLVSQGNLSRYPTSSRTGRLQCPRVGNYVLVGGSAWSNVNVLENA